MDSETFSTSPFIRYFPVLWDFYSNNPAVHSLTRTHGLKTKVFLHNITDPYNENRSKSPVLITYEIRGRRYDLFSLQDLHEATYAFDDEGFSNMKGDLAERVARRVMKRFLQRFDHRHGKLGGLFDKRFNPKKKQNYVVANSRDFILKIGSYPNMILLKKTGHGHWGYQHVTDLDGLFDFRYLGRRHLVIMESKIGKIDINADALFETLFVPLRHLFPEAEFTYVLFAGRDHLLDNRHPEYRILQDTPVRIFKALRKHGIPTMFFEFNESDAEFTGMCRHLITSYRTYHNQNVNFQGQVSISDSHVTIYNPGSKTPYLNLVRDPSGMFRISQSARNIDNILEEPVIPAAGE